MKNFTALFALLTSLLFISPPAQADKPLNATLCNYSSKPVQYELFNHNDLAREIGTGIPFMKLMVRDCSCVEKKSAHTDLWNNLPIARIKQVIYRDVGKITGTSISACISAKGKFEGYIDATASTCVEAKSTTSYLPAPELTLAQGDLPVLDSKLTGVRTRCIKKSNSKKCKIIRAKYDYTDGRWCTRNN